VIGVIVGMAASTVGKVLRRCGVSRLPKPERVLSSAVRGRPGELVRVDSKKLGCLWAVGAGVVRRGNPWNVTAR
jgi:hypothetical protein